MTRKTDYTNGSQQRILQVLLALAGNEINGLSPKEIAQSVGTVPGTITRDLDNLKSAGFAEQITQSGRWRLGPRLAQIGIAVQLSIERARQRAEELEQRYTCAPITH